MRTVFLSSLHKLQGTLCVCRVSTYHEDRILSKWTCRRLEPFILEVLRGAHTHLGAPCIHCVSPLATVGITQLAEAGNVWLRRL